MTLRLGVLLSYFIYIIKITEGINLTKHFDLFADTEAGKTSTNKTSLIHIRSW